jgi:Ca2+-binding RTX toxin-like protein
VSGGAGNDRLIGARADDALFGDGDNDTLRGSGGDDTLPGGAQGFDVMTGGADDDSLDGGTDDDRPDGGKGDDTLRGGTGGDSFLFSPGSGRDVAVDYLDGTDKVDVGAFDPFNFTAPKAEATLTNVLGGVRIDFGDGDVLVLSGVTVAGLSWSDFVF